MIQPLSFFIDNIGNRIYRDKDSCNCNTCNDVFENGMIILDEQHAGYLDMVQNNQITMKTTKPCKICKKEMLKGLNNVCSTKCQKEKEKQKKLVLKEKKATSPKKLYKENVEMAKKIAKIRDNYTCQWCGSTENIHGSHIINEARDHRLATYEFNIKALCFHCHMNLWHKEPNLSSEWFNNKFPGRYELLNKLHIEYAKEGKITREWHMEENKRLKDSLKELLLIANYE